MAKFHVASSEVNYDSETGYVSIEIREKVMTPHQAFVFAMDLLSTVSPVIQKGQELLAR